MTESEWLASAEPLPLLVHAGRKASKRKLRLFGCACCRHAWHLLTDDRGQRAVVTAERYADGLATDADLARAMQAAQKAQYLPQLPKVRYYLHGAVRVLAYTDRSYRPSTVCGFLQLAAREAGGELEEEARWQADALRDVLGNPFRPAQVDPGWTAWGRKTVPRLARAIYDDQAYDRLPILADALEDAGCADQALMAHCRDARVHVRGCWALDLLLGLT